MKDLTYFYCWVFVAIFAFVLNFSEGTPIRTRRAAQLGEFNQNLKPREPFKIIGTSEDFKTGFVAISGRNSARGVDFENETAPGPLIEKKPIWVILLRPPSRANAGRSRNANADAELEATTMVPLSVKSEDDDTGIFTTENDAPAAPVAVPN